MQKFESDKLDLKKNLTKQWDGHLNGGSQIHCKYMLPIDYHHAWKRNLQ